MSTPAPPRPISTPRVVETSSTVAPFWFFIAATPAPPAAVSPASTAVLVAVCSAVAEEAERDDGEAVRVAGGLGGLFLAARRAEEWTFAAGVAAMRGRGDRPATHRRVLADRAGCARANVDRQDVCDLQRKGGELADHAARA